MLSFHRRDYPNEYKTTCFVVVKGSVTYIIWYTRILFLIQAGTVGSLIVYDGEVVDRDK